MPMNRLIGNPETPQGYRMFLSCFALLVSLVVVNWVAAGGRGAGLARLQIQRIGFACNAETCHPVEAPRAPQAGLFREGVIDLTGDGVEEKVHLADEQVIVYHGDVEAWRGLPEWRVVDVSLGDPNDDGREELLLALWKPDAGGTLHSHPFIVGYREGAYRVLWGGSAVVDAIHEVELGDVDGDGMHELVALAERGAGHDITVWNWHGWGFSLAWRSPAGRYRDLTLISGPEGYAPTISVGMEP